MIRISFRLVARLVMGGAALSALAACRGPVTIEVDDSVRFQVIEGWSATVEVGDSDRPQERVQAVREELLDWVVDSVGINRLRLSVKSGYENRQDLAPAFFENNEARLPWVKGWFQIENDNDDPRVADPDGFQFFFLDHLVETVVLPVRERLEARGESLYLLLNYVDFGSSPFEHRDDPEEFAEFLLVVVSHLDQKYGLATNGIEVNEPDNDGDWSPRQLADAFVAAGKRLEEAGYRPDFLGPETITTASALQYFEEMEETPGLARYWTHFSFHTYRGRRQEDLRSIAGEAERRGMRTAMTEFMNATHAELHEDLTLANVSAWEKFSILSYVRPDSTGSVNFNADSRLISQYFRSVERGAVRVGATSSSGAFAPVAFVNPDGDVVLILRASRPGRLRIRGLPSGTYRAFLTEYEAFEQKSVALSQEADGSLAGELPRPGLLVLRGG